MDNLFWLIWDAASYEITQKLLIENELPNVKKLIGNGIGCKMMLHDYNCQTPCALATQFTGCLPQDLEIGGYHTPNYLFKDADRLKYELSFLNKNVGNELLWHKKHIGKKRIGSCQIPFSNSGVNDINNINGYAKKKYGFKILYYSMLEWNSSGDDLITSFMLHERKYNIILKANGRDVILKNSTGQKIIVKRNDNQNNNVWLDDRSGYQFFVFDLNDDNKIMFLFSDVWEYLFEGFTPNSDFKDKVGVFMGVAYGRQYRNSKFGTNYYHNGDGTAERIYLSILENVALCFNRMSEYMINKHRYDFVISYQPCIDEVSHEFYGWWKNSVGEAKEFYWDILKKAYEFGDDHLGVILDHSDNNDNIVLTSDHGIYSVKYSFYINEYLNSIGLLSYNNDNTINDNRSSVYFHPANTGAMFFKDDLPDEEKIRIKELLKDTVIDGVSAIKELKDTKREKVFGDLFIIPETEINILAERNDQILTKTVKSGCHTVNNNESSMSAIFCAGGKYFQHIFHFNNIKNTDIKPLLIDIVSRKVRYKNMIKIAFYGKSGSGKSTIAKLAIEYFKNLDLSIEVIKFATPLYNLQKQFYDYANVDINYTDQNQKLMEDIAKYLREINPNSLVYSFNKTFEKSNAAVVINDDVRDTEVDYPYLKKNGFFFIKLKCDEKIRRKRLLARNDLSSVLDSATTNYIDQIVPDIIVDTTSSDISKAKQELYLFLNKICEAEK